MDKKQRSALRRFRRAHEFLTSNTVEGTSAKLAALDEIIRQMTGTGEEQDASDRRSRGETVRQAALRQQLWDRHMVPISRIARRVFGVPEMDVKFRLPRKSADNQVLLDAGRGMAQAAEQHAEVFTQEGLPVEFVAQLRGAIEELSGALGARVEHQRRRQTSRQALQKLVKRGVAAVDVLDAIVKPRLQGQPELLTTWNRLKRPMEPGGGPAAVIGEPDISPEKAA